MYCTWVWDSEPSRIVNGVHSHVGPSPVAVCVFVLRKHVGGSENIADDPHDTHAQHDLTKT